MEMTFGRALQNFRKKKTWSQQDLADKLDLALGRGSKKYISKSGVSKWERDERHPTEEAVEELEELLDAPKGSLLKLAGYANSAAYRRTVAGEHLDRADNLLRSVYEEHYREHLQKLTSLAKELIVDIENSRFSTKPKKRVKSTGMFGGLGLGFGAQENLLWPFLLQHLDNEFRNPLFSEQIRGKGMGAIIVAGLSKPDQNEFAHDLVEKVKERLILVSERGTFKGTCKVCESWFADKPQ